MPQNPYDSPVAARSEKTPRTRPSSANGSPAAYTARHLSVLEGLEAVRKRPGMYIGSTDSRGLMHCLWEIIDNSVDEALEGHASRIDVILHRDGSVEVRDDGRGVPVDTVDSVGLSGVEVVYTKLHAGGKFGGGGYAASGGLHGVGASVVNALSARMDVSVDRGGRTHRMQFRRGEPGRFDDLGTGRAAAKPTAAALAAPPAGPDAPFVPFTESSQLDVVGKVKRGVSGTRVRYWADRQIFPASSTFLYDDLVERIRQTTFLVPGLTIVLTDDRPPAERPAAAAPPDAHAGTPAGQAATASDLDAGTPDGDLLDLAADLPATAPRDVPGATADPDAPAVLEFRHDGGVVDYVDFLAPDAPVTGTWHLTGSGTFDEVVQQLDRRGHLRPVEVERTCEVDIALRWGNGFETIERTFVNIIATPKGGAHLVGFEQAALKVVRKQIEVNARRLKVTAKEPRVDKDDVLTGLTAVVTVRVPEPQFEGQTKEVLGTAPVRGIVANVVEAELNRLFASSKREDKAHTAALLEKVVAEMRARVAARTQKEISRRKNALESSTLPAKLADCRSNDVAATELFIVEGDSALGTAKDARNSEFQALLPIRGKILNVQKASPTDILNNAEVSAIIQVVGAGSGRSFDLDQARYGKVILMTDADVDGAHIRTLLLTLFYRYMRPLVEAGRVFAAVPPLHRVETAGSGGRAGTVTYTYSDEELNRHLAALRRAGKSYKEPIQRYKGLGEMDAHQLAETTMEPAHRTLRRITVADLEAAHEAERVFELLMGNEVAPRRDFIVAGAQDIDRERIDA